MTKFILYVLISIITFWSMDCVDINRIFKQGQVIKARVMYFLILLSIIYLVTNFVYDFIYLKIF